MQPHDGPSLSRREQLRLFAGGFGYMAFAALAGRAAAAPLQERAARPHFRPKAKRVIMIFMQGGVSHLDTFDPKPRLQADDGKELATPKGRSGKLMASPWRFARHGRSGQWVSELLPHTARQIDDLCVLSGMHTDAQAHETAVPFFHTGNSLQPRPSVGAWVLYGLGSEASNLPGFIAMNPMTGLGQNHASAFLPAAYQAALVRPDSDPPIPNLSCGHLSAGQQRSQLDLLRRMNLRRMQRDEVNGDVDAVIKSYEMAFRMQASVPGLLDFGTESEKTLSLYGIKSPNKDMARFAVQCLMARRFAERGVRFIEIGTGGWDHHKEIRTGLPESCERVDQPIAALLQDLKQRGMLEDTLVVWAGEFGRTPVAHFETGRDHNNRGFTIWMAGGGVKAGYRHGQTDEYGREAVAGRVHVHDLHATMLHLLGLDHEKLTYPYGGRDYRLTDVYGNVVKDILA